MYSVSVFIARVITGIAVLCIAWFTFEHVHDRNTEIITAVIGLQYAFIFLISRRLVYFGLSVFSFFGRTVLYIQKLPYDQVLRDEIGLTVHGRHLYLNVIFAALLELLCVFRLFTSLLGLGWRALSDPMHNLIVIFF